MQGQSVYGRFKDWEQKKTILREIPSRRQLLVAKDSERMYRLNKGYKTQRKDTIVETKRYYSLNKKLSQPHKKSAISWIIGQRTGSYLGSKRIARRLRYDRRSKEYWIVVRPGWLSSGLIFRTDELIWQPQSIVGATWCNSLPLAEEAKNDRFQPPYRAIIAIPTDDCIAIVRYRYVAFAEVYRAPVSNLVAVQASSSLEMGHWISISGKVKTFYGMPDSSRRHPSDESATSVMACQFEGLSKDNALPCVMIGGGVGKVEILEVNAIAGTLVEVIIF